ncbi:MAG: hypothetical protein QOK21_4409 [Solirubrobacteraceae bacterium]|nr:hypothetical protein [Solirubrobacteraceae bacterium]
MRRLATIVLGVVVVLAIVAGAVTLLAGRDDAGVDAATAGAGGGGVLEPDRGARHLQPADHVHRGAGPLPTSGPHHVVPVEADRRALSVDQVLEALELGDVVLTYPGRRPDPALVRVQRRVAGRFSPALAAAGQAIILTRSPASGPATALAWRRRLRASGPSDPALERFADAWLGRGLGR